MADTGDVPELAESAGFLTLSTQMSREAVDRVIAILRRELAAGRTQAFLAAELYKNLPDYDDHSRQILLTLGADTPPADDFPPAAIASSTALKANTLELQLLSPPAGLSLFSLAWHQNRLWLVTEFAGNRCVLKTV